VAFFVAQPFDAVGSNSIVAVTQSASQRGGVNSLELFADDKKVVAVGAGLDETCDNSYSCALELKNTILWDSKSSRNCLRSSSCTLGIASSVKST